MFGLKIVEGTSFVGIVCVCVSLAHPLSSPPVQNVCLFVCVSQKAFNAVARIWCRVSGDLHDITTTNKRKHTHTHLLIPSERLLNAAGKVYGIIVPELK